MEALSKITDRAVGGGYLRGFTALTREHSTVRVSNLLFVDDTLAIFL